MKKLAIIATEFNETPEAWEVLNKRGWTRVIDTSTISGNKKLVNKSRHTTPLINVEFEEWEYGG